ncbi:MAG TPA: DUF3014 domain-containing protein [Steroidobacteraceae bacterium]|jgi:hypothetical protein|nr:DUF3014 domain-containing protein [Steroidobacteraceae bacterium]
MEDEAFMDKAFWWVAAAVVIVIAGGGIYYYRTHKSPAPPVAQGPLPEAAPAAEPAIRHPIPGEAAGTETVAPPPLEDSDVPVRTALLGVFGDKTIDQFLVPKEIIRHVVVTVDNLPRKKVAVGLRPVKATPGKTVTGGAEDTLVLGAANYERYAPLVQVVRTTDTKQLARVYFHFYPLFQQAYENLGYPSQYFNDRLVEVIDDMLKAPDVQGPIELVQPRVFYEYKDRDLESRSAGQKLLIRMGPANAAVIKSKLRELRSAILEREKSKGKQG